MTSTDKATPPPAPNFGAALPRKRTYLGRRSDELIALLQSRAAREDIVREIDRVASFLSDRLDEWDYDGRNHQWFYAEAADGLDALERAKDRIIQTDLAGALSEIEAASFKRDPEQVAGAYRAAMEADHDL